MQRFTNFRRILYEAEKNWKECIECLSLMIKINANLFLFVNAEKWQFFIFLLQNFPFKAVPADYRSLPGFSDNYHLGPSH